MDSGLNGIGRLFESIVSLFSACFGFLPSWVLVFIGGAFAFMLGVFVYKLLRG